MYNLETLYLGLYLLISVPKRMFIIDKDIIIAPPISRH